MGERKVEGNLEFLPVFDQGIIVGDKEGKPLLAPKAWYDVRTCGEYEGFKNAILLREFLKASDYVWGIYMGDN